MSDRRRKRQTVREEQKGQPGAVARRPTRSTRPDWPIETGWKVYTADSAIIGTVSEVIADGSYFIVRGGNLLRRHTLYVPLRFVRGSGNGNVMLRATKGECLTWRQAPTVWRSPATGVDSSAGH